MNNHIANSRYFCKKCFAKFFKKTSLRVHKSHCNGKRSYEKFKNKHHSEETRNKISKSLIGKSIGRASTVEKELVRKIKISETAKRNGISGGYRPNSGRSKKVWYESKIAGKVFLQSSWEVKLAEILDSKNIKWKKNWDSFSYNFKGKNHKYIPDFYLEN
jgi:hypothetical protein